MSCTAMLTYVKDRAKTMQYHREKINRKGFAMMNGYDMGYGGIWMGVVAVLAILAIAALVKYLRK